MSRAIDMSDLPEPLADAIEAIIRAYRQKDTGAAPAPVKIGWARGRIPELPDSFFDPLPPDVLDMFEGKAP